MSENKKRKRTKNTTNEQYELYLEVMETDYNFRSNTINPTLPPNYIQNKWQELSLKLNAIGDDGPTLSSEEWKKRFTDWKYATKAKARKIENYRKKTGGGPSTELKLNNLEERALNVWGRVTVEGAQTVTQYEGISFAVSCSEVGDENLAPNEFTEEYETITLNVDNDSVSEDTTAQIYTPTEGSSKQRSRPKPLSVLAQKLISITEENITSQKQCIETLKKSYDRIIKIKEDKLDFEIKKFKFLHPDFNDEI